MDYTDSELLSLMHENNDVARDILYDKYKYIVINLLKKYQKLALHYNIDLKELEQEAYYAFSDALSNFMEDKNASLSTFIYLCINRRIRKIIKRHSGKKAQVLSNSYSLDYDYEDTPLQDILSDDNVFEPLNKLTKEENFIELIKSIKASLSPFEYEVFSYLIDGLDYQTIAKLTNKNLKQVDNTIQRVKHKIRDIIKD